MYTQEQPLLTVQCRTMHGGAEHNMGPRGQRNPTRWLGSGVPRKISWSHPKGKGGRNGAGSPPPLQGPLWDPWRQRRSPRSQLTDKEFSFDHDVRSLRTHLEFGRHGVEINALASRGLLEQGLCAGGHHGKDTQATRRLSSTAFSWTFPVGWHQGL